MYSCTSSSRKAGAVDYEDLAPILDAGYRASLLPCGCEPAHFAVLKNQADLAAAQHFLHPFSLRRRRRDHHNMPTVILISLKRLISRSIEIELCGKIMDSMKTMGIESELDVVTLMHPTIPTDDFHRAMKIKLDIPPSFSLLGILGFSYSDCEPIHGIF